MEKELDSILKILEKASTTKDGQKSVNFPMRRVPESPSCPSRVWSGASVVVGILRGIQGYCFSKLYISRH